MNHRLAFKKVNKAIIFNQNVWLKPYIEKKLNIIFKNNFFFCFFFYQGYFSRTLTTHRTAGEGRGTSYSTLPLPVSTKHKVQTQQECSCSMTL